MKNNTKIRLHLSKQLFESLAKQVLTETKANGGGAYTEVVKAPKAKKEKAPKAEKKVEEMETKVAEAAPVNEMDINHLIQTAQDAFNSWGAGVGIPAAVLAGMWAGVSHGVKKQVEKLKADPKHKGKSDDELKQIAAQQTIGALNKATGGETFGKSTPFTGEKGK